MKHPLHRPLLRVVALAAGIVLTQMPAGFAQEAPRAPVEQTSLPDVDLFPAQSLASLSPASRPPPEQPVPPPPMETVESAPEMSPPPEQPLPFSAVASWKAGSVETFAIEGFGQTFLLCKDCHVASAIHPGEQLADGYQLKSITHDQATLVAPDGKERSMPLISMAH